MSDVLPGTSAAADGGITDADWQRVNNERDDLAAEVKRLTELHIAARDAIFVLTVKREADGEELDEQSALLAAYREALKFLPDFDGDIGFREFDAKYPECPHLDSAGIAHFGAERARAALALTGPEALSRFQDIIAMLRLATFATPENETSMFARSMLDIWEGTGDRE